MEKYRSFDEIQFALKKGESDCRSIVKYYLQNIQTKAHLNAFVEVYAQSALEQAALVDEKIAKGTAGKLAGMIVGIKDILNYEGHPCTAGSNILKGYISQYTATAVQRLIDEDAIVIGRLNCDEFGMGSSNEHSAYGKVYQELDPTRVPGGSSGGSSMPIGAEAYLDSPKRSLKIAVLKEALHAQALQPEIKRNTLEVIEKLKTEGHEVQEVDFPQLKYVLPTYYILTTAVASANLARFDGVKYGYRTPQAQNLEQLYKNSRSEGFGEEVKRRIMLGTFVLSASYHDAYFTKAQKVRRIIRDLTAKLLTDFDYLILPTTPTTAFKFGEHGGDPVAMYLEDLFTVQASVSGVPALSIPNGKDDSGMPIGLQVIANSFKEEELYAFGHYLSTLTLN